jgi:hypothetical protein
MLDILWSQWSTLGAFLSAEETTRSVVDPEAALVAACSIGRADPRLFDEVLDWLRVNADLIRPVRLNGMARNMGRDTVRVLAAAVDYASEAAGKVILPSVVERGREVLHGMKKENLFSQDGIYSNEFPANRELDPLFLKWGLMRGKVEVRHYSRMPDLNNPANVMVSMRKHYSQTAKADTLTYLMTGKAGNSYQIARMIDYNQSTVYRALVKMSNGGPVTRHGKGESSPFWVDRQKLATSVGINKLPVFFNWAQIYGAYNAAIQAMDEIIALSNGTREVLAIEAVVNLAARIIPAIRGAGVPLEQISIPNPATMRSSDGASELMSFLETAMDILNYHRA